MSQHLCRRDRVHDAVLSGLYEKGVEPTWIASISIGVLNTAILASNAPGNRVEALKDLWSTITKPDDASSFGGAWILRSTGLAVAARDWASGRSALCAVLEPERRLHASPSSSVRRVRWQ